MNVASKKQKSLSGANPWQINQDDFPHDGSTAAKFQFLLNYAVLAPSGRNTQPWRFQIVDDVVELYADKTRALADPDFRELVISCGAALFHLRIAIRHFGYQDLVEIFPESLNSQLLARIRLGSRRIVKVEENFLFRAILRRSTNRLPFNSRKLSASLISELESATCSEGDWLQIMTKEIPVASREAIINLIAQGDRLQMSDPLFRQELAQWIHSSNRNRPRHDGMSAQAQALNDRLDVIAPLISFAVRAFTLSKTQAQDDHKLTKNAPTLIMISSRGDTMRDWLATGEALAHLLLRARVDDVWASFFNQPIEIPQLRSRLQNLFPENGFPQILLRLGYSQVTDTTPRRAVAEFTQ
ncbi:MAG: nitroreductase [Cyanobacteria bacterium P01_E01_bin.35]